MAAVTVARPEPDRGRRTTMVLTKPTDKEREREFRGSRSVSGTSKQGALASHPHAIPTHCLVQRPGPACGVPVRNVLRHGHGLAHEPGRLAQASEEYIQRYVLTFVADRRRRRRCPACGCRCAWLVLRVGGLPRDGYHWRRFGRKPESYLLLLAWPVARGRPSCPAWISSARCPNMTRPASWRGT